MLFIVDTVKTEELNTINNFFASLNNEFDAVVTVKDETPVETPVTKYISSLVCGQYAKAVEEIENTTVGNKIKRSQRLWRETKLKTKRSCFACWCGVSKGSVF